MNVLFSAKLNKAGADMIGDKEGVVLSPVNKLLAQDVPEATFKAIEDFAGEGETPFWHVREENKDPCDYTIQEAVFLKEDEFEAWSVNPLKVRISLNAPFAWFNSPLGWSASIDDMLELPYDIHADGVITMIKDMVGRYGVVPLENISSYEAMAEAVSNSLNEMQLLLAREIHTHAFPQQYKCKATGLSMTVDLLPSNPNDFL